MELLKTQGAKGSKESSPFANASFVLSSADETKWCRHNRGVVSSAPIGTSAQNILAPDNTVSIFFFPFGAKLEFIKQRWGWGDG